MWIGYQRGRQQKIFPEGQKRYNVRLSQVGNDNGNGLLFHMTKPTSRSTIKAIACSKPIISEN